MTTWQIRWFQCGEFFTKSKRLRCLDNKCSLMLYYLKVRGSEYDQKPQTTNIKQTHLSGNTTRIRSHTHYNNTPEIRKVVAEKAWRGEENAHRDTTAFTTTTTTTFNSFISFRFDLELESFKLISNRKEQSQHHIHSVACITE